MWRDTFPRDLGLLTGIHDAIVRAQVRDPSAFPNLRDAPTILITSDYSGSHAGASYETYSFLRVTPESWGAWEARRLLMRQVLGFDRTISFKQLSDKRRMAAMPEFLHAAGKLSAFSFSIVIDRRLGSLFEDLDPGDPLRSRFAGWKDGAFEKARRVTHLIGLLLAGLSAPGQDVFWFTDQDDIAANTAQLKDLTALLAVVASHLAGHDLGHLRCGTSASDNGTKQLEDLIAVPDLIAGAVGDLMLKGGMPTSSVIVPPPATLSAKARVILNWFSDRTLPLRRIVMAVEPGAPGAGMSLKVIRWHGTHG